MIHRLVFLFAIAGFSAAQYRPQPHGIDPAQAAILSDSRYLSGDGTFGAAYTQEDGVEFKEESDVDGNRRGSYSYIDPSGQRRTITYTAGKNGFQASGDHLPVPPAPVAPPQPQPQYQPQYQPQPQPQPQYQPQYQPQPQPQPQYQPQAQYQPQYQPQPQPQYRPQTFPQFPPQPAAAIPSSQYDDGQYRESYNVPRSGIPQSVPAINPAQYSYSFGSTPSPISYSNPVSPYGSQSAVTPAPHRFFPPGKLDLNRTPDGFSYNFSKS